MALKDTDLITYGTLKSVVAKQNEVYDARYVAKSSLTESPSGNLRIVANNKGYELLSTNSAINVNKLEGVIGIEHIHPAALERVVVRENQAARFALTENDIQLGDVVKENDTGKMYFVVDVTNLNNANGYMEFAVGTAANVSWENVSGKPNVSEVGHTHSGSDITSAVDNATNAVNATNASNVPWTGVSNKPALAASLSISGSTLALKDSEGVSMSSVELPESSGSSSSEISSDQVTSMTGFEDTLEETYQTWDGLYNQAWDKVHNQNISSDNLTGDESNALYGYVTLSDGEELWNIDNKSLNEILSAIMWMIDRRIDGETYENDFQDLLSRIEALENGGSSGGSSSSTEAASSDEILEGVFGYNMNPECSGKWSPDGNHHFVNGTCEYCGEPEN